jgi:hypothetical protein
MRSRSSWVIDDFRPISARKAPFEEIVVSKSLYNVQGFLGNHPKHRKGEKMVNFETLKSEKKEFGRNNFLEVARKKAITEDGENEFISVSRGYFLPDGSERFKKSLTIPDDEDIKKFVAKSILEL